MRITFGKSWEKQEAQRVYRMEQLRKLYNAWQDQVGLWDTPLEPVRVTTVYIDDEATYPNAGDHRFGEPVDVKEYEENGTYVRIEYTPAGRNYYYDLFKKDSL